MLWTILAQGSGSGRVAVSRSLSMLRWRSPSRGAPVEGAKNRALGACLQALSTTFVRWYHPMWSYRESNPAGRLLSPSRHTSGSPDIRPGPAATRFP